jgi:hypothetical protein
MKTIRQFLGHCIALSMLVGAAVGCALLRWLGYHVPERASPFVTGLGDQALAAIDALEAGQ